MHHTDCALAGRNDAEVRSGLSPEQLVGSQGWEFLAMPDPDAALAADVEAVRTCEALPVGIQVEGWRYDVATGAVVRVVPTPGSPTKPAADRRDCGLTGVPLQAGDEQTFGKTTGTECSVLLI